MANGIKIRKALNFDVPQLEKLFLETRKETFSWISSENFVYGDYKASTKGEVVYVALDKNKIVGFISIWEDEKPPFIHNLYIAKSHQRRGVGRALINSLFSWLPLPYQLKCIARNRPALQFYLKNNWVRVGQGICNYGDEYILLELRK